jgi:hypothetical protein
MKIRIAIVLALLFSVQVVFSQDVTQSIKGKVVDKVTGEPLPGASVVVENTDPIIGTITDFDGNYILENVKVGRHNINFSYLGYNSVQIPEVLLSSVRPFILDVGLEVNSQVLEGVEVTARKGKEASNSMATLSARSFTVEESSRFAGGLSDPSRVAYNFAGVTFSSPQDNGVVIRGNAPSSVLWRLNGIDVSGLAHFAGGNLAGAGLISTYSANTLKSSDFFTGAYPAEYANSTSGVFDIQFRKGDNEERKHMVQLGILGLDLASEGPIKKGGKSSYLVNYRHGFVGYYGAMAKGAEPHFQDLSFQLNLPTEKKGDFAVWGIGGTSKSVAPRKRYQEKYDEDKDVLTIKRRQYFGDFLDKDITFGVAAAGVNHKIRVGERSFLRSVVGFTSNYYQNDTRLFHADADTLNTGSYTPYQDLKSLENKIELASTMYSMLNSKLSNETGVRASVLSVDAHSYKSKNTSAAPSEIFSIKGNASNISAYTQFKYQLLPSLTLNAGLSSTKFQETDEVTLEPRAGLKWQYLSFSSLSLAYGKHTKREELKTYFYLNPETGAKNDLLLSKSGHYIANISFDLSSKTKLSVEAYYQSLYDVPVVKGTPYSFVNYTSMWQVNGPIINNGTGINKGVDFTLEQVMHKGFYYMLTASLFDSKYTDAQGVERNTLYNRNYLVTLATGKEFVIRGKNLLGFNMNVTYMGGGRLTPYLLDESLASEQVIYDSSRMFDDQFEPEIWLNAGITYKINKKNSTRTWGIDFQNALITEKMAGYKYNFHQKSIDEDKVLLLLPNLYYKIEF